MNPMTTGMHIQILSVGKCIRRLQTDTMHSKMIRPKRTIVFCGCTMVLSRNSPAIFGSAGIVIVCNHHHLWGLVCSLHQLWENLRT